MLRQNLRFLRGEYKKATDQNELQTKHLIFCERVGTEKLEMLNECKRQLREACQQYNDACRSGSIQAITDTTQLTNEKRTQYFTTLNECAEWQQELDKTKKSVFRGRKRLQDARRFLVKRTRYTRTVCDF